MMEQVEVELQVKVEVDVDGALCEMNNLLCSISAAAKCANCICQRNEPRVQIMCTSHIRTSHTHICTHAYFCAAGSAAIYCK